MEKFIVKLANENRYLLQIHGNRSFTENLNDATLYSINDAITAQKEIYQTTQIINVTMENENNPVEVSETVNSQNPEIVEETAPTETPTPQPEVSEIEVFANNQAKNKLVIGSEVNYVLTPEDQEKHNLVGQAKVRATVKYIEFPNASLEIQNFAQGQENIVIESANFDFNQKPGTFHLI